MGGGPETASNEFKPPEWTAGRFPGAIAAADRLASQPYQLFAGPTRAEINPYQQGSMQLTADRALYGDPQMNAARGSLMNISQGGAQNPFMDNAYTNQMIGDTANNMASGFAQGTAADNAASAARSGAFGGSAYMQKQSMDAANLARQIGQMGTATRQQDITRKGNLWQQDVGNVMNASIGSLPFAQQDQSDIAAMMGAGNFQQQYLQGLLGDRKDLFNEQTAYPYKMLDYYLSALAKGSGQYGTNYSQSPGQSNAMNVGGGLMGLAGLLGQ